ncbi:MAG: DUF2442 domain-containing protein [Bacteroidetes bacterium]|nr:DUF2442 domain-containing protein [Bacteroidota bacterium]
MSVKPFEVTLLFNTGEVRYIDFKNKLKQWTKSPDSIYHGLLNPDYFNKVKLLAGWDTIYWDNGIDFCPDMLYRWSLNNKSR